MKTSTQNYAELMKLRNNAGELAYQRIALAATLMEDKDWVGSPQGGGGNSDIALTRLEDECFGDLCGAVSLVSLLEMYYQIPKVEEWKRYKFNLRKIWNAYQERQGRARKNAKKNAKARPQPEYIPPHQLADLTPTQVRHQYERVYSKIETMSERVQWLDEENVALKAEVAELKEQIRILRRGAMELFKAG